MSRCEAILTGLLLGNLVCALPAKLNREPGEDLRLAARRVTLCLEDAVARYPGEPIPVASYADTMVALCTHPVVTGFANLRLNIDLQIKGANTP